MTQRLIHVSNDRYFGGVPEVIRAEVKALGNRGIEQDWLTLRLGPKGRAVGDYLNDSLHGVQPRVPMSISDVQNDLIAFGRAEADRLRPAIAAGSVVMLHDPLALALAPYLRPMAHAVLWRSHIGADHWDRSVQRAVQVLDGMAQGADALLFHRAAYVWPALRDDPRVMLCPPGIDPEAAKNACLDEAVQRRVLPDLLTRGSADLGALRGACASAPPTRHGDGPTPVLTDHGTGWLPAPDTPFLLQVARWDRHKGHDGVLRSFADRIASALDGHHLVLLGPRCTPGFSSPDNLALLNHLRALRASLPPVVRGRIHLWSFCPGDGLDEALCVNLLQRSAHTIVQKSTREGFGISVTEAMWKGKVVVASAVGGLRDQITDRVNGVLSDDVAGTASWADDVICACTASDDRPNWARRAHASSQRYLSPASADRLMNVLDRLPR